MTTAILSDGMLYTIPKSDIAFFKAIASKMGWRATRVDQVLTSVQDIPNHIETASDTYTLSKLKGRFTSNYYDKETLRDHYLSDKFDI